MLREGKAVNLEWPLWLKLFLTCLFSTLSSTEHKRSFAKEHKGPPPYPKLSGEAGMLREKRRINRKVLKACAPW